MADVAIYLNPEAFDTKGRALMGRQSAGESFLRGYLRFSRAERFRFWNVANRKLEDLTALLTELAPIDRPVEWIARQDRNGLAKVGNVHLPQPKVALEAWHRNMAGFRGRYGVTGITHTTASIEIMDYIADLISAPIDPWDTLICTSSAVRHSVEVELEAVRTDFEVRLGADRLPQPAMATIPLAINTEDFSTTHAQRKAWREKLDIPDDAVVVLYMGRFNAAVKMNPLPMALALERAARATDKAVYWVQTGWAPSAQAEETYHRECQALCPSVHYRSVDGRPGDVRFSIWSVADLFISLSDNVQETFGLTPLEAMAAGLPCVVSDWDGYRDTLRHKVDGFRIPTYAPASGTGRDLIYRHSNAWIGYDMYVGAASQMTAVSIGDAAQALLDLIENPDLRRRMGASAQARARTLFDWSAVIPQYEDLWDSMSRARKAAPAQPVQPRNVAAHPRRLDPFHLFGGYATEWLSSTTLFTLAEGSGPEALDRVLGQSLATYAEISKPTRDEALAILEKLKSRSQMSAAELTADVPAVRRPWVERGLLWMAKYDLVVLLPRSPDIAR